MPMIDVYAAAGTFRDSHALAQDLAAAVMRCEQVPDFAFATTSTPPRPTATRRASGRADARPERRCRSHQPRAQPRLSDPRSGCDLRRRGRLVQRPGVAP
jgi:hypothetical protein